MRRPVGLAPGPQRERDGSSREEEAMHRGSVRVVLVVALMCVAAGVGCARSREYVSLSYQPTLEEGAAVERGPTLLLIPSFTDAREGMDPNIVGYVDRPGDQDWYSFILASAAPVRVTLTDLPYDYDLYLYDASGRQLARAATRSMRKSWLRSVKDSRRPSRSFLALPA